MHEADSTPTSEWLADYVAASEPDPAEHPSSTGTVNPPPLAPKPRLNGHARPLVPARTADAPEPLPGRRDRNWWRDLGRRTAVRGRERNVLGALLDRIWTGADNSHERRVNGQWTGWQRELQADCGNAICLRTIKRAVVGLVSKGIIERRFQGRMRTHGGGRGKSVYRVLPSNPHERRQET